MNYIKDKNYIVSSLPGTMDATIGGIISNNTHGKDVKYGNFSNRVISLKLLSGITAVAVKSGACLVTNM